MNNKIFMSVLAVILIGGVVAAFVAKEDSKPVEQISGVEETEDLSREHVPNPDYGEASLPPVGGEHSPVWAACNRAVHEEPLDNANAVHSLEHGAVWITYNEDLPEEELEILKEKLSIYTFISPYPQQPSPVVVTAWGTQMQADSANDTRIDDFIEKYRQGPQTPEPGASCDPVE